MKNIIDSRQEGASKNSEIPFDFDTFRNEIRTSLAEVDDKILLQLLKNSDSGDIDFINYDAFNLNKSRISNTTMIENQFANDFTSIVRLDELRDKQSLFYYKDRYSKIVTQIQANFKSIIKAKNPDTDNAGVLKANIKLTQILIKAISYIDSQITHHQLTDTRDLN